MELRPVAYVLRVLDVGTAIDLDRAAEKLAARASRGPAAVGAGPRIGPPGGVLLARRPVDVPTGEVKVGDRTAKTRVRLFEFGVAAVRFEIPLGGMDARALAAFAAEVGDDAGFDEEARKRWATLEGDVGDALTPGPKFDYVEDYTVFLLPDLPGEGRERDEAIARILLGEPSPRPLAARQIDDVRKRAIQYFADDLVAVDYDGALVVEPQGTTELVDLFELASAHLLELRYYDALLSRGSMEITRQAAKMRGTRGLLRSPFERATERAMLLVLELTDLADAFERAIILLGDAYSVQVYQTAVQQLRIDQASASVHGKLDALARTTEVLTEHVQSRRGTALELLVVVMIALEIGLAIWRH